MPLDLARENSRLSHVPTLNTMGIVHKRKGMFTKAVRIALQDG